MTLLRSTVRHWVWGCDWKVDFELFELFSTTTIPDRGIRHVCMRPAALRVNVATFVENSLVMRVPPMSDFAKIWLSCIGSIRRPGLAYLLAPD